MKKENIKESVFSERLRWLRKKNGLTHTQLAEKIARETGKITNKATICGWETGTRAPKQDIMLALAKTLNTTVDYLIGTTDADISYLMKNLSKPTLKKLMIHLITESSDDTAPSLIAQLYEYQPLFKDATIE